jgi:hypothetical protein
MIFLNSMKFFKSLDIISLFFHKGSKHPNFILIIFVKVKAIFSSHSDLQQIIIQTFLRNLHLLGRFFQTESNLLSFGVYQISIVQFPPFTDFFYYISNFAFLGPATLDLGHPLNFPFTLV